MRNVSSTITSASAKPAATSPLTRRKRWQTFVPATGRTPIETSSSAEAARVGVQERRRRARPPRPRRRPPAAPRTRPRRAARRRGPPRASAAATAATTSPAWRATSARTRWSRDLAAVAAEVARRRRASARRTSSGTAEASTDTHARVRVRGAHERGVQHARAARRRPSSAARRSRAVDADRGHAASSSTARRTSTAITRRRYVGRAARVGERLDRARRSRRSADARVEPRAAVAHVGELLRRSAHGADDDAQPVAVPTAATADARPVLARARAELAVRRPAPAGPAPAPRRAARPGGCTSRTSRGSAPRSGPRARRAASAARPGRRGPQHRRRDPRRSRRRRARRRRSPGCAPAGWRRRPNARASIGQPRGRAGRARRVRWVTIAPRRSSPSSDLDAPQLGDVAERQQRRRAQEALVDRGCPGTSRRRRPSPRRRARRAARAPPRSDEGASHSTAPTVTRGSRPRRSCR